MNHLPLQERSRRPGVGRLGTIEMGRGIAAVAVVLFHANAAAANFGGMNWSWTTFGEHGVDFFFVLSGFIIFTAHRADIGHPSTARAYLIKRSIRLLPLLWAVVILWSGVRSLLGASPPLVQVLGSLLLWPSTEQPIPVVVWTLRHEVLFYAVFSIVIVRPRLSRWLLALWVAAVFGQAIAIIAGVPATGAAALPLSSYTLDFIMGGAVAELHGRGRLPKGGLVTFASVALLGVVLLVEEWFGLRRLSTTDYISPVATFWTPVLGIAFSGIVVGLLAIEDRVSVHRWAILLGGASYAIYLVHIPIDSFAQRIAARLPSFFIDFGVGHVLVAACGIVGGIMVHLAFEVPVMRWLRHRYLPRSAPAVAEEARL